MTDKKILLLGATGKMGLALQSAFAGCEIIGKNSRDFDAGDLVSVDKLIAEIRPDIVLNTAAFLGIDPCEQDPQKAFRLNTLYPKRLAELSAKHGFILAHFSTDAVFNDDKKDFYVESDAAKPLNIYGTTKYGGDCFVSSAAKRFYIFRISVLFGESVKNNQFVEKMLQRIAQGQKVINISDDIIASPTYSKDAAQAVRTILESGGPYGVYHLANEGKASLYELMGEVVAALKLKTAVKKASYLDFPFIGAKNTNTPLKSEKIPPLRPWREAVRAYCAAIRPEGKR